MKGFFIFLFLLYHSVLLAQRVDPIIEDNQKANHFITINKDSTRFYANRAFEANKGLNPLEEAKSLFCMGVYYKSKYKYDTAFQLFTQARNVFETNGELRELGRAYWYLGKVWHDVEYYEKAIPMYLQSIATLDEAGDNETKFKVMNGLGVMEVKRGNFGKSLDYFLRALEIVQTLDNKELAYRTYNNIAVIYQRLSEYDKALGNYKKALDVSYTLEKTSHFFETFLNLAEIHRKLDQSDSAEFYFQAAINLEKETSTPPATISKLYHNYYEFKKQHSKTIGILRSALGSAHFSRNQGITLNQLANLYLKTENVDSALYFATKGYEYNLERNIKGGILTSAGLLAEIYDQKGDYEQAYKLKKVQLAYKDTLLVDISSKSTISTRVKLETLEKSKDLEILKAELLVNELERISFTRLIVIIFILIILVAIGFIAKMKSQKRKLLERRREDQLSLERKSRDLQHQTLNMISMNHTIEEMERGLQSLVNNSNGNSLEVKSLIKGLKIQKNLESEWNTLQKNFSQVNPAFSTSLREKHQDLSKAEYRLCLLTRLNLAPKEIATLLNVAPNSIKVARYRLKKNLSLRKEESLDTYLESLDSYPQSR
ncbi:MAG: tetratricopeptide repeat protein [Cyclobacteriaceae bacterium]